MFTPRKPARAVLLATGTLLSGFGLAGCSSNPAPSPPTVVSTTTTPAVTTTTTASDGTAATTTATSTAPSGPNTKINVNAGPGSSQGTDEATGEAVNKAIVTNKEMTGARVEAVVTAGVASLTGSVQNAQQKMLAEKAARDTPGVSGVKNKLQINPTGGAKSATKPPTTKVIVIHKTEVVAPNPSGPPAPTSSPSGNGTDSGASSDTSTGTAGSSAAGGAASGGTATGTSAPASNGNGQ